MKSMFEEGDLVKVVQITTDDPEFRQYLGHVGTVRRVLTNLKASGLNDLRYRLEVTGAHCLFFDDELVLHTRVETDANRC